MAEPPRGCLRGQRNIAGPGLQRAVYSDDCGGRLGGEDPPGRRAPRPGAAAPGHLVTQPVQREIHTVLPPANPASPPAVAGTRNGPPSQEPAAMAARQLSAARRASPQTEALRREPSIDQHRVGIRAASASPPVMNSSPGTGRGRASLAPKAGSLKQWYAPLDPMYLWSGYPAIGANKSAHDMPHVAWPRDQQ